MSGPAAPRRARHLMDPDRPRVAPTATETARLERVKRTVLSVLTFTTIIHLAVGLIIGAQFLEDRYVAARVGLCLLGGLTGVLAVAATRAIHRAALLSPWLLAGLVPAAVGIGLVLG